MTKNGIIRFYLEDVMNYCDLILQIVDALSSSAAVLSKSLQDDGLTPSKIDEAINKSLDVSFLLYF